MVMLVAGLIAFNGMIFRQEMNGSIGTEIIFCR